MTYSVRQLLLLTMFVAIGMVAYPAMIRATSSAPTVAVLGRAGYDAAWRNIYLAGAAMGVAAFAANLIRLRRRKLRVESQQK